MSTSDPELVDLALERIAGFRPVPALLHPIPTEGSGKAITDVDLVWGSPVDARTIGSLVDRVFDPMGLHLVMVSPYDHDAAALFAASRCGRRGIHLDVVHDAKAYGRLGIHYPRFLELGDSYRGRLPVLDRLDQLLYLARKRHWKGQFDELERLRREMSLVEERLRGRGPAVLTRAAWSDVAALLNDGLRVPAFSRSLAGRAAAAVRLGRRLRHPVGAWLHLEGDDGTLATELSDRFRRVLVRSTVSDLGTSGTDAAQRWLSVVAPLRWRPGLVLTFGRCPNGVHPDAVVSVSGASADVVASQIVDHLGVRARRFLPAS